jgi:tetratricopeptide (TPR) repeat protein
MELRNLPLDSNWQASVRGPVRDSDAFCFIISAWFEKSDPCLAELAEVRHARPEAPRFLVLVDLARSRCVEAEVPILLYRGLGGVGRRHVIDLADRIDASARHSGRSAPPLKSRRQVAMVPDPLTSALSQADSRLRREEIEARLLARLERDRVLAVWGMPSSGRSALVLDALQHLDEHRRGPAARPLFVVATRECGGSVPDLRRLCSTMFESVGPPPATAAAEPAAALCALLDECDVWLLLDQFETAAHTDGRCRDPELAKFLRIADETLERGRVVLTAATPGVVMEGGRRCAHFSVPEWSAGELDRLARHIAHGMEAQPPAGTTLSKLRQWACGSPYLLLLALREWYATGSPPPRVEEVRPFLAVGRVIEALNPIQLTVLQVLSLLSTFPTREHVLERAIQRARAAAPLPGDQQAIAVADDLRHLVAAGLVQIHHGARYPFYQLPGLVTHYIRRTWTPASGALRAFAESAAACILDERDAVAVSAPIAGPAIHDGRTWLWPELSSGDVSRAVQAADVLINAELTERAVRILTGGADILKRFNRIAPASVRRRFFESMSTTSGLDPRSSHEAMRALALALADAAEFATAVAVLDDAAEMLALEENRQAVPDARLLEAKNLDLKAYCQRQLGRLDESILTYELALGRLGLEGYPEERCKLLRGLANSWTATRDWGKARSSFEEARARTPEMERRRSVFDNGRLDCDTAILEIRQGHLAEADSLCRRGREAMRSCGDLWNERIAALNQCGIDLARTGDVARQVEAAQGTIQSLVQLESVVALRAARTNIERLTAGTAPAPASEWWVFVELT